jgi:hypothetical protein
VASQYGQDLFVLDLLDGLRGGFFLDSGASDGVDVSNTFLLEASFGWSGVCVEPNGSFFAALKRNRRCYAVNCCLFDEGGSVEFLEASSMGGILTEYHPSVLQFIESTGRLPRDHAGLIKTVKKPAHTVGSVLRECHAPPVIDYWSLDTEGSELAILKNFPFGEYSFRVLTVEHNFLPVRSAIRTFLEVRGYIWIKQLGIDDCYVNPAVLARAPRRSYVWTRQSRLDAQLSLLSKQS